MKRSFFAPAVAVFFAVAPAMAATPMERTKGLLEALKGVHVPPEGGGLSAAQRGQNEAMFATIDGFFDYDHMVDTPIAKHEALFKGGVRERYRTAFRALIRAIAYPRSGTFLKAAKLQFGAVKQSGAEATVALHTELAEEDYSSDVMFYWGQRDAVWLLQDVSFDGASLVKDYANQFARLITKDGAGGLVAKLESRLAKIQSAQQGAN